MAAPVKLRSAIQAIASLKRTQIGSLVDPSVLDISSIPSLAHVGVSRYAARYTVAKSGKTKSGLCLNCRLVAVVQFDHLGACLAVEHGRDSR